MCNFLVCVYVYVYVCVLAEEVQRRDVRVLRGYDKRVQQIPVGGKRVALRGFQPPREAPEEWFGATER